MSHSGRTYVIRRLDQAGGYLSPPGSPKTWTASKARAHVFPCRESAQSQCCDNERPVPR
jgi:hypothetical protein